MELLSAYTSGSSPVHYLRLYTAAQSNPSRWDLESRIPAHTGQHQRPFSATKPKSVNIIHSAKLYTVVWLVLYQRMQFILCKPVYHFVTCHTNGRNIFCKQLYMKLQCTLQKHTKTAVTLQHLHATQEGHRSQFAKHNFRYAPQSGKTGKHCPTAFKATNTSVHTTGVVRWLAKLQREGTFIIIPISAQKYRRTSQSEPIQLAHSGDCQKQ